MMRTTTRTFPGPHCETLQAFRPADATAFRTGLRGPSFVGFARSYKLPTNLHDGVGVNAENRGRAARQSTKIEFRWPADRQAGFSALFGFALSGNTEVPYMVTGNSVAGKVLAGGCVLDAEFECENAHVGSVLLIPGPVKSALRCFQHPARSPFVPQIDHQYNKRARFLCLRKLATLARGIR